MVSLRRDVADDAIQSARLPQHQFFLRYVTQGVSYEVTYHHNVASQLPQQRIVPFADLATRPVPFDAVVGWDEKPGGVELFRSPTSAAYLGTVEWAWFPTNKQKTLSQ
jgi:hypothetical protein